MSKRRSGMGIVGVVVATVVTATAYGASAAPRSGESHVLDSTYSCQVRPER